MATRYMGDAVPPEPLTREELEAKRRQAAVREFESWKVEVPRRAHSRPSSQPERHSSQPRQESYAGMFLFGFLIGGA